MKLTESKLRQLIREELQTELFGFSKLEKAIKEVQKEMFADAYSANVNNAIYKHLRPLINSSGDAERIIKKLSGIDTRDFKWMKKSIRDLVPRGR
jgi:hypothetical protein